MVYSNQFNFVPFYCRFECFSISVSANDPHFRDPTKKCMTVIRSDAAPPLDCSTGIYSNSFKTHNITVSEYMLTIHKFRNENNSFMKLKYLCSVVAGIRQQQNQRSSFIDGTMIYGFNKAKEDSLRTGELGNCSYVIYFLFCTRIFTNTIFVLDKKHRYKSDGACIEIKCVYNIDRFSKGKR